ncbi:hypothetical protein BDM02DRAFT_3194140 [Thelephora ganbajun]|uniref:Uncharacterized protein n=1 Tax=Thelephora ganbajun TaxID=370292 RepID=A0ACB6YXK2_THEGA|nr:hypothetical protein BDM02DRAFT_3194140 [Thelephora ganbajun]
MPDGNILQYTQKNPSVSRLMFLAEDCHGVSYLHGQDISHGCIAPDKIMVTRDGWACIGDFIISGGFSDPLFVRFKLGTALYMGLECVRGHHSLKLRIQSGERPSRPTDPDGTQWLRDSVWGMVTTCWSGNPNQ